jgi:protoporphyrin/coproporphyrin ferrochelatase
LKRSVLLLNIGTPDSPAPKDVAKYLKQFLMDPLVIDLPYPLRWFLVNIIIVPRRSQTSSEAYSKIWTERGSPLKFNMQDLTNQLKEVSGIDVEFAMRYQNPTIESALMKFKKSGVEEVVVVPLYPQYSLSATKSSIEECQRKAREVGLNAKLKFVEPFYAEDDFILPQAELIKPYIDEADHILFSFHGLPKKQIKKTDETRNYCLSRPDCCAQLNQFNKKYCYRAQSFETAQRLATALDWPHEKYSVSFQSRLTNGWIRPYTDEVVPLLARHNVKNLVVACPSFTVDCLETIEEIGIRARELFLQMGGEELRLVSCLNSEPEWAKSLYRIIQKL